MRDAAELDLARKMIAESEKQKPSVPLEALEHENARLLLLIGEARQAVIVLAAAGVTHPQLMERHLRSILATLDAGVDGVEPAELVGWENVDERYGHSELSYERANVERGDYYSRPLYALHRLYEQAMTRHAPTCSGGCAGSEGCNRDHLHYCECGLNGAVGHCAGPSFAAHEVTEVETGEACPSCGTVMP